MSPPQSSALFCGGTYTFLLGWRPVLHSETFACCFFSVKNLPWEGTPFCFNSPSDVNHLFVIGFWWSIKGDIKGLSLCPEQFLVFKTGYWTPHLYKSFRHTFPPEVVLPQELCSPFSPYPPPRLPFLTHLFSSPLKSWSCDHFPIHFSWKNSDAN